MNVGPDYCHVARDVYFAQAVTAKVQDKRVQQRRSACFSTGNLMQHNISITMIISSNVAANHSFLIAVCTQHQTLNYCISSFITFVVLHYDATDAHLRSLGVVLTRSKVPFLCACAIRNLCRFPVNIACLCLKFSQRVCQYHVVYAY